MATGFQDSTQIVHDLFQKNHLITAGPPKRYCLPTTRSDLEKDGSVRKWRFGQRNLNNKILLMVGETGAGKTTLINAMVNYTLGVKFTDEVWFDITEEGGDNPISDQSKSQTTKITVYEIFVQDNQLSLTIIDTPGYGDTRGRDVDKQIAENLYKLFCSDSGVKEIDAVCLVVKASENRLSDRQQYIFDALLSLFGKDIENNIVIFITNSIGLPPANVINLIKKAGIACRRNKENEPDYFLFNNCQTEPRCEKYNTALQTAWKNTEDTLSNVFASLKEYNRKSVNQTEIVLAESKQLEACITNLQGDILFVENKIKQLAQTHKSIEENLEKIKRSENFTFTVTKYYKEKVNIRNVPLWDRKVTACSDCKENCHEFGCWCAWNPGLCYVMKNEHCTVCTGKCHYSKHVRENKKYVTYSEEITMTYNDLKQHYKRNNTLASDIKFDLKSLENVAKEIASKKIEEEDNINIQKCLQGELEKTEMKKADLVEKAYTSIMKLTEIALKPDSAFIIQALDFLIPQAEETGKLEHAQKLRELRKIQLKSQKSVYCK